MDKSYDRQVRVRDLAAALDSAAAVLWQEGADAPISAVEKVAAVSHFLIEEFAAIEAERKSAYNLSITAEVLRSLGTR